MSARQTAITAEQLASLSHEFRTPLNGVLGMAQLLAGTRLTAEQQSYVSALAESGQHLLGLVNEVLDFAKLGAGRIETQAAEFDLEDLLRQVAELVAPRAHEKGLEIGWAAAPGLSRLTTDEGRLRQVLLNFLGNAVKFTQAGGVLLTAEPRGGAIRFTVADSGPGVPAADRARVFEPFVQTDPAHAHQLGGAGLGLAIAQRLAEAMGGAVGLDASPLGGAAFWVELPGRAGVPDQALAGRRVVVASARPALRDAAARQVAASGGEAVQVASRAEAVAAAADVILIDEALIGEAPAAALGAPAIVLLSPAERDRIAARRRQGFEGYLIKPLRRRSLAERIGLALGQAAEAAPEEDDRIVQAELSGRRVLLAEDDPISAILARTLLAREGCEVDHVANGEAAVEAAAAGAYDLILMDVRMPRLSGMEAARRLRAQGAATPIVALTADAFEDDRRACLAAGMDDFLVKPLAPEALRGVLTRWAADGWTRPAAHAKLAG
ncbi:MAG TPA: response regulator [Phenylobacterium sp.]|nr:response regulator [Phenylobacterium sp.]